jgi:DHA1 family bicyclomycin/chloramphenicol resistance-like MFS transporter
MTHIDKSAPTGDKPAPTGRPALGLVEFVILMAMLISLVALSIDAMLPALPQIGVDLGVQQANDTQLIIATLFIGMALGQIVYGPLSDTLGRKPTIYIGLTLFIGGCVMSMLATDFNTMLAGRVLQGIGAAGPRIVTVAMVRDQYEGRAMARIMSLVMMVFILVPALAPALGQGILLFSGWRAIFAAFLLLALIGAIWFALRQPETLTAERRRPFSLAGIAVAVREICTHRIALGYTFVMGIVSGAFIGYLNSAQAIFQDQYRLGTQFPLYFAVLALAIGSASLVNSRLVMRYGMRLLSGWALLLLTGLSAVFWLVAYGFAGHPPLWSLMIYCMIAFFCIGMLFGNLNALAMEPLGHIAGVGAAVVGSLSTFIALPLGVWVGHSYNGTVLPLVSGFALLGAAAAILARWIERGK